MNGADIAGWVSALAAFGAFAAAAVQLRLLRRDNLAARRAEIEGVALETDIVARPIRAELPDGRSRWRYRFAVHNPGRLPITQVETLVRFPLPVQREHYDGTLATPATTLDKPIPVIPAGGRQEWERTILIPHTDHELLRQTTATVTFTTLDAGRIQTRWPQPEHAQAQNKTLRRLLARSQAEPSNGSRPTSRPVSADQPSPRQPATG